MELQIYSSEKHNRSNLRYVIFGLVCAGTLTGSIFAKNRAGALLLFFLLGGYFYYSVKNSGPTSLIMLSGGLQIGAKILPRTSLRGFVLEIDTNTKQIKNIVLVTKDSHSIHTIHDDIPKLRSFVEALNAQIPLLEEYPQNIREKILRRLKV